MEWLLMISSVLLIGICCSIWILPTLLSWILALKFQVKFSFGISVFPYFKLKNVQIRGKDGLVISIKEIRLSSSLINSRVKRKLAFVLRDFDVICKSKKLPTTGGFNQLTSLNKPKYLSRLLTLHTILKYVYIHINEISLSYIQSPTVLLRISSSKTIFEGCVHTLTSSNETLLVTSQKFVVQLFKTPKKTARPTRTSAMDNVQLLLFEYSSFITLTVNNVKSPNDNVVMLRFGKPQCFVNLELFDGGFDGSEVEKREFSGINFSDLPLNYLPKNFLVEIGETETVITRGGDKTTELKCTLNAGELNLRKINVDTVCVSSKAIDLNVSSMNAPDLIVAQTITIDAEIKNGNLMLYVIFNNVQMSFDKSNWPKLFRNNHQDKKSIDRNHNDGKIRKFVKQLWRFYDWDVDFFVEFWNYKGYHLDSTYTCNHCKLSSNLKQLNVSSELLFESISWNTNNEMSVDRKYHRYSTPVYLAVALFKFTLNKDICKIDAMFDTLRLEWNEKIRAILLDASDGQNENSDGKLEDKRTDFLMDVIPGINFNVAVTNVNVFFIFDRANFTTRLDTLQIDGIGIERKFTLQFTGCRVCNVQPNKPFICTRSDDITDYIATCRSFDLEFIFDNEFHVKYWSGTFVECVEIYWTHEIHLQLLHVFQSFRRNTKKQLSSTKKSWSLQVEKLLFSMKVGRHTIYLDCHQTILARHPNANFKFESAIVSALVDNARVLVASAVSIDQTDANDELVGERQASDPPLELERNNAWICLMSSFEMRFPYEHEFGDAIQNELVSTVKWLKKVHGKRKRAFTLDSPLPCDILIKINECIFELSDDPFEIRLRDNYELLEDEYKENLKRVQLLNEKIEDMRRNGYHLPPGKVEDLHHQLLLRSGAIYVERSKQIQNSGPQRTRLLAWHVQELGVNILADTSYHGTERVVEEMQRIDPFSPWPCEELPFTTLWARTVSLSIEEMAVCLRDFPQPLLNVYDLKMWGKLIGAEAMPSNRSIREVTIEIPAPFGPQIIERGMTQLKFFHDFSFEIQRYTYAFGPCWEPVIAQCNLSLERIFLPSHDPSPPLPFWDKARLLFHGRLTMLVHQFNVLLHASLDPYNTTEEMGLMWTDAAIDWVDGKIILKGDFDVNVRTASKYDDCRLLHIPSLKVVIKLDWVCLANPYDHHSVIPCAPDKLPEYSSNQIHDSYRAFRSQNVDVSISLETKGARNNLAVLLLYGSTLKWFESLKFILSGVTRPTRRGALFNVTKPRRKPLSRHYRRCLSLISFHGFQISYWMSFARQHGCEIIGNLVVCNSTYNLSLVPYNDGLKRRPRALWSINHMICELNDAVAWLKTAASITGTDSNSDTETESESSPVEKYFCLSVKKVSYTRESTMANAKDRPTHLLVVHSLRGAWTKSNRDVFFALFEAFIKSQQLKKNLSSEALRSDHVERDVKLDESSLIEIGDEFLEPIATTSKELRRQSPVSMLEQLIAEVDYKSVVHSDDQSPTERQTRLKGQQACQQDDVVHQNWSIILLNSQVILRGCETKGYTILSSSKTEILQRLHVAVTKRTWVGCLEGLQCYATVGASDDNINWLPEVYMQETHDPAGHDPAAVVGSGRAAGGIVSEIVGANDNQLQRVISKCRCEFFYVSYGSIDQTEIPQSDAFTLMFHTLVIWTNSIQYAMLLDIINSLILYTEPTRKEAAARLARLKFLMQLRSDRSVKVQIQKLQTHIRDLLRAVRRLERDAYLSSDSTHVFKCQSQLNDLKSELSSCAQELNLLLAIHRGNAPQSTVRAHEICFTAANWQLTDADGQLGIANLTLKNFLYTKNSRSDGSTEHLLELGFVQMQNMLPGQPFKWVLTPTQIASDMPIDAKNVLRIFCREKPPVGGISVKEHFEINVVPITLCITKKLYGILVKFFFPEKEESEPSDEDTTQQISKNTNFYVKIDHQKDDVEKMKERAEKNKLFIYIKIPEVPVRVSYKGNREKNIEDFNDISIIIPTLEYHNVTWTWLDLFLAMKSDMKRVIISQALKQKLQINRNRKSVDRHRGLERSGSLMEGSSTSISSDAIREEEKKKILFGKLPTQK